jgi:uncharacterized protein (TIGR02266 family)
MANPGDSSGPSRQHPRIRLSLAVSYRTTGAFLVAYSVNLSKGGLFIEAPPLPIGTRVHLELELPRASREADADGPPLQRVGVEGVVTWVRTGDERQPAGMGIQFVRHLDESIGLHIDALATAFEGLEILVVAGPTERRSLLSRYVKGILDCECVEADRRRLAAVVLADGVDLALVDLDTMGPEGMEVVILAAAGAQPTPVIALSNEEEGQAWAKKRGVDQVLPAPPSFADLPAAVLLALSRPIVRQPGPPPLPPDLP